MFFVLLFYLLPLLSQSRILKNQWIFFQLEIIIKTIEKIENKPKFYHDIARMQNSYSLFTIEFNNIHDLEI